MKRAILKKLVKEIILRSRKLQSELEDGPPPSKPTAKPSGKPPTLKKEETHSSEIPLNDEVKTRLRYSK